MNLLHQFQYKMQQGCLQDSDCQSLFHCVGAICQHNDIFPLSAYTITVYVCTGIAAAFCNVSGNSMGIFKILILMILLQYELDEATGLAQALVVGTALPNFLSVIFKKHPNGVTSLVNYKLLSIIIPCVLLGSTTGALTQTLIPKLAQLILNVLVFSFFVFTFAKKLKKTHHDQQADEMQATLIESTEIEEFPALQQYSKQKQDLLIYEKSYHLPEIGISLAVFMVFEFLSFLVQGKLPFYSVDKCELHFPLGFAFLLVVTLVYIFALRIAMVRVYRKYRRFQIKQDVYLDNRMEFYSVVAGAFAAGMIQGVLGMGCGTCIMMVLLSFPINSTAASATSGYQILFTGTASLMEYYANGQVRTFESIWMMSICCVVGGLTTLLLYQLIQKLNPTSVNRFLYIIILCLCVMSIVLTVPTGIGIVDRDGWEGMMSIDFKC